jgi:hypothetical protein
MRLCRSGSLVPHPNRMSTRSKWWGHQREVAAFRTYAEASNRITSGILEYEIRLYRTVCPACCALELRTRIGMNLCQILGGVLARYELPLLVSTNPGRV